MTHRECSAPPWNDFRSPETNAHIYGRLIFKTVPRIFMGEGTVSTTNGAGRTGSSHATE